MKITALLTGKGNNTFKGKNLKMVCGHPVMYYPAAAAKNSEYITNFYVSSDDDDILNSAAELGYKKIKRPDELAKPDSQHIDVINHFIDTLPVNEIPDILVVLLANSVTIKTNWIDESIKCMMEDHTISSVIPVEENQDNHPYRAKRIDKHGNLVPWFDFSGKRISTNRQDLEKNYFPCHNFWTLNVYNTLINNKNGQPPWTFFGNKIKPLIVSGCFDIHNQDDLKKSEDWIILNQINTHEVIP